MIGKMSMVAALAVAIGGLSAPLAAAPCKDAKGKFVKCPPVTTPVRCKDAKGKFTKCSAPGAVPIK
ncbi:hypothetical protein [Polymorphobacter fuscus]|uniref:Uncharacterized protein n=1 Tax=Sandarakinorhabdus fusca TaxID=1439888 RepID=A0A7C9GRE4_9SPHN|nr:hypothetical protein [Polymorphobacter fuscus]KAB7644108.1 hypothetical protein F9290_14660 [Polymorphobacter fuscus]MQT18493.1 hypothetical protein [Polymorphobacter fuscus]NJC08386.1 hypothetical protein [Polymorphobacter fuscus]